jgi:hypothetical protein
MSAMRLILGGIGFVMLLAAFALFASGMPGALIGAIWLIPSGIVLLIVAFVEVSRYRSASAELDGASPGPGGGEPAPLDARFRRTDEVFVDPSSQRTMRVFVDTATGERRYVAEK